MSSYVDLTMLGGRHQKRLSKPDRHNNGTRDRLVCAEIFDGNAGWPSVNRYCACGGQLWVSVEMLESVDSGVLDPLCWPGHLWAAAATQSVLELHPGILPTLYALGRSQDAYSAVAHLNRRALLPSGACTSS